MSKGLLGPQSEKVRSLELSIEEIRQAKDELIRMSNDKKQRVLYYKSIGVYYCIIILAIKLFMIK